MLFALVVYMCAGDERGWVHITHLLFVPLQLVLITTAIICARATNVHLMTKMMSTVTIYATTQIHARMTLSMTLTMMGFVAICNALTGHNATDFIPALLTQRGDKTRVFAVMIMFALSARVAALASAL